MSLLAASGLRGGYGGADILKDVSLMVATGEIVVIVGPNGAGKSTALKALAGIATLRAGRVTFDGADITGQPPHRLASAGLAFVPQERNTFPSLTVRENLEMGAYLRPAAVRDGLARAFALFPRLAERERHAAGALSGGERQMLAIGRALMLHPKLLLLDEPTAALSPLYVQQMFGRIGDINRAGTAILMVEQNARHALAMAHRGYVLADGTNRFENAGPALLADPGVAQAFLGG